MSDVKGIAEAKAPNLSCGWDVLPRAGSWWLVRPGVDDREVCHGGLPWAVAVDAALEFMDMVRTGWSSRFDTAEALMEFCVGRARRA